MREIVHNLYQFNLGSLLTLSYTLAYLENVGNNTEKGAESVLSNK